MNDKIVYNLRDQITKQYEASAMKTKLIKIDELIKNKYSNFMENNNKLFNISLKRKKLENSVRSTRFNFEKNFMNKDNQKTKSKIKSK